MTEALLALIPSISTAFFVWLWRREKKITQAAVQAKDLAFVELAKAGKLILELRALLIQRNVELRECRENLPPAAALDDFFDGLPKRDPGKNNS
jgi:hypothetical protein